MRRYMLIFACLAATGVSQNAFAQSPINSYRSGGQYPLPGNGLPIPPAPIEAPGEYSFLTPAESDADLCCPLPEVASGHCPDSVLNGGIRLDTATMFQMLDFQNRQSDKQLLLLHSQAKQKNCPTAILGAQFRGSGLVAHTNREDRFSYLGRFPPDFTGSSATDLRMLHANQGLIAHANSWATGYVETLFSDVFSFPDHKQGSFQVRQAYAVLGNLDKSPVYAFIGKKNVTFGSFETLSPFTQSVPWHYFAPLAEGGGVGLVQGGLNLSAMALSGGRGIRVSDSSDIGSVNNYAVDARYTVAFDPDSYVSIAGGYLNGTIYNQTTAEHLDAALLGPNNGAWDINAKAQYGPWVALAEYVETIDPWPVTDHKVQAWQTETAWNGACYGIPWLFSASYSSGIQGSSNDEFEFNNQLVLGTRYSISPNVFLTFEYVRSIGFAPLINITQVSDKDVRQNSFVFGFVAAI